MSSELLREAAALMRKEQDVEECLGHISLREYNTWLAVADLLDAMAEAHIHIPGSDREKPVYDMPGMDNSPAALVARAYLGES
jgi:hypothetical protein